MTHKRLHLTASADAELTAGGATTLTAAKTAKSLTVGVAGIGLTKGTLAVAGTLIVKVAEDLTIAGTLTVGTGANTVTLTKAAITGDAGTGATLKGADGSVTLIATDVLDIADMGTVVVAGSGSVVLPNSAFGAGTYTAAGAVTITAVTAGDTIETGTTAGNGLILGSAATALSLLGQGTTAATYTLIKAASGKGVVFGNGAAAIVVGNGLTSEASSVGASATAKIVLGTTDANKGDAIGLGNGSTLVLAAGATIGVFDNTSTTPDLSKTDNGVGGAVASGTNCTLPNTGGTLTATTGAVTLTGASAGTSSITTDATITAGS